MLQYIYYIFYLFSAALSGSYLIVASLPVLFLRVPSCVCLDPVCLDLVCLDFVCLNILKAFKGLYRAPPKKIYRNINKFYGFFYRI